MLTTPRPDLPATPVWLPFSPGPYRMTMGLIAQPFSAMTAFGTDYPAQMAERRELLERLHDKVFGVLAGSEAARAETLKVIVDHLLADRGEWFAMAGGMLENRITGERWNLAAPGMDPLELAGRLVQEDLCLLHLVDGVPVLVAAVLCFPSRWRLAEKLGRKLAAIHEPVPLYAEKLARPVDRFIGALKPGRMVERFNWAVHDDPTLFQPFAPPEPRPTITVESVGQAVYLRVERQTLSVLPESGAVLFTIRTRMTPLAEVMAVPGAAADLAGAIRALPDEVAEHKSRVPFGEALLTALDRVSAPR